MPPHLHPPASETMERHGLPSHPSRPPRPAARPHGFCRPARTARRLGRTGTQEQLPLHLHDPLQTRRPQVLTAGAQSQTPPPGARPPQTQVAHAGEPRHRRSRKHRRSALPRRKHAARHRRRLVRVRRRLGSGMRSGTRRSALERRVHAALRSTCRRRTRKLNAERLSALNQRAAVSARRTRAPRRSRRRATATSGRALSIPARIASAASAPAASRTTPRAHPRASVPPSREP